MRKCDTQHDDSIISSVIYAEYHDSDHYVKSRNAESQIFPYLKYIFKDRCIEKTKSELHQFSRPQIYISFISTVIVTETFSRVF